MWGRGAVASYISVWTTSHPTRLARHRLKMPRISVPSVPWTHKQVSVARDMQLARKGRDRNGAAGRRQC